jgi:hypothetical protein
MMPMSFALLTLALRVFAEAKFSYDKLTRIKSAPIKFPLENDIWTNKFLYIGYY